MRGRLVKSLAWALVAIASGGGLWWAFRPAPAPCDVGTVDRGPLAVTVDEDGRTRLKERYIVSAPLGGVSDRITLDPGDPVVAGETVITRISALDPSLLDERALARARAQVRTAEAALARAEPELAARQAEADHQRAEYQRVLKAGESDAATLSQVETELMKLRTADHARDAAGFALEMARYELEQARAALIQSSRVSSDGPGEAFQVRPPISGRVLRVVRENAGVVNPGDPLVEIGSLDGLEVEADVLSDLAVRVRAGQRVSIEEWGGPSPLAGVVRIVEPSGFMKVSALGVEEQRVNVIIDLLDPPEARGSLGDNFRVQARITVWESSDVVRVPVGALFRRGDAWGAYVMESGVAKLRIVRIGERSESSAEVHDGLEPGETVIVYPSDRVRDGARVRPRSTHRG